MPLVKAELINFAGSVDLGSLNENFLFGFDYILLTIHLASKIIFSSFQGEDFIEAWLERRRGSSVFLLSIKRPFRLVLGKN